MPFIQKEYFIKEQIKAVLFLIQELKYTQREAQRFIAKGRLFQNGEAVCKSGEHISGKISFIYFEAKSKGLNPIFQTKQFAMYDKPSGVLVHPQNRNTPYSIIDEAKSAFGKDANITHRIDQETSGVLLVAKNKISERKLKMMFENREIKKSYLALVHERFPEKLSVDAPLLRRKDESAVVRMVVRVDSEGKPSQTNFKLIRYYPELNMSLIEAFPLTGRQHQIRVHLFHVKHPIVGDPIYGQKEEDIIRFLDRDITTQERVQKSGASRLLLHANSLSFKYINQFYISSNVDFAMEALHEVKRHIENKA